MAVAASAGASPARPAGGAAPAHAPLVLGALILVAVVANLNLTVSTVALPDIGAAFNASQTSIDLISVGYSLGLAGSVLYLGALGDRHGRKTMLLGGVALSVPASLLAAYAPDAGVLVLARVAGGVAAGMAYPTTLALITALWANPGRTRAIAMWSSIGGASSALGPLLAGALLQQFWWGSVFLTTLPLAAVALVLALRCVPAHVNETTGPVDNLGGAFSILLVAALVLCINFAAEPGGGGTALTLLAIAVVAGAAFVVRQRRAQVPLYDLHVAGRRVFGVAAVAGIIVFGALMGALFVGQQFLQDVLGYSALESGAAILPAAVLMVLVAPQSARLIHSRGSRFTLLAGYLACLLGFLVMLLLWREGSSYWQVGLAYALIGLGVGLAGTPASHSLTGSVPVTRAGMASGTADLQRDLGGAIMQSLLGALLAAGYASAFSKSIASAPNKSKITGSIQDELEKSFSGATQVAHGYPQYASKIVAAAKSAFLAGDQWAYTAGIVAVMIGAAVVLFLFPGKDAEERLLARYHAEDQSRDARVAADARRLGQRGLRNRPGAGIVEQCRHAAAAPMTPPWPVSFSLRPRPATCTVR
jgi:DHA2 family multidrug resistance protein-like MFS transporter